MPLTLLNPWVILGAVLTGLTLFGAGTYVGHDHATLNCKAAAADRRELLSQVRSANLDLARGISKDTETQIGRIRVTSTTINNEVRHEREIHHRVLENPDCAVPASTIGVLNRARGFGGDDRPGAGEPDGGLPAAGEATRAAAPGR